MKSKEQQMIERIDMVLEGKDVYQDTMKKLHDIFLSKLYGQPTPKDTMIYLSENEQNILWNRGGA
jgi:hypothetical protein